MSPDAASPSAPTPSSPSTPSATPIALPFDPAALLAAAHASRDAVLARLERLVRVESPSGDAAGNLEMARLVAERHRELGASVTEHRVEGGANLLIEYPARGASAFAEPILLVGHVDTVWDRGTLDGAVPWSVDGDVVRGPGAFDMKSGLVAIELAMELAQRLSPVSRPVRVVVTCDEEIGSPSSTPLVAEAARGVSGALGFESPHPDGTFKVGRRGSTRVRIAVTGREAHAALDPDKGVSAVDELVDQLVRVRGVVAGVLADEPGSVLCNVGRVAGGERANVIPGHAEALIGLRFTDLAVERRTLSELRALADAPVRPGAEIAVEVLSSRPTWKQSDGDLAWLAEVAGVAEALGLRVGGEPAAGAADTNLVGSLGVPTLDGFGPVGGGAHAVSEHLSVSSLLDRVALLAGVVAR